MIETYFQINLLPPSSRYKLFFSESLVNVYQILRWFKHKAVIFIVGAVRTSALGPFISRCSITSSNVYFVKKIILFSIIKRISIHKSRISETKKSVISKLIILCCVFGIWNFYSQEESVHIAGARRSEREPGARLCRICFCLSP